MWKEQSTMLALFGRRILGQYPAAPSSPGPFVLLLNCAFKQGMAPFCSGDAVILSQGQVPFVPGTGLVDPDTVLPKMFMFIGSFLA